MGLTASEVPVQRVNPDLYLGSGQPMDLPVIMYLPRKLPRKPK